MVCGRFAGRLSLLLLSFVAVLLIFPAMAFAQAAPTIQSDKDDYKPGETVTLTGSNWQPGESVHIRVNDDEGQTWSRDVDVTADDNGQIQDQFQLPNSFVAVYTVTATGAQSGVATTSFTDGNVTFIGTNIGANNTTVNAPSSWTVNWQRSNNNTTCTAASPTAGTTTISGTGSGNAAGINSSDSLKLGSVTDTSSTVDFDYWSTDPAGNNPYTNTCIVGANGNIIDLYAHFKSANSAPNVGNITGDDTANEGQTKSYSVTATDPDSGDTLTYAWSITSGGSFAHIDGAANNSSVSLKFDDGPSSPNVNLQVVVDDGKGHQVTKTLSISVANVAPTVTLAAGNDLSVNEGSTEHTYSYTVTDPGQDTFSVAATYPKCGDNGTLVAGSSTTTASGGSFKCTFPDGDANSTVAIKVADSDSAASNEATQTVEINNVAPTATLSNDGPINEGGSATVSFSGQSDVSADTTAGLRYAYHCDGSDFTTAPTYSGASASDSTTCSFADNGTHTVKAAIIDKDGGYNVYSTDVTVNNAPPSVTAPANQNSDEGENHAFSLGSFSDAGANDGPWAVDVDWGDGSAHTTFNTSSQGALGSQNHEYADNGTYTVKVKVTDKDGGSNSASFTANVANVAPTVSFTGGPTTVDEDKIGSVEYTFSVSDPGTDGFTVKSGFPDCGTGGSPVGSVTTTANGGSFNCRFSDGLATPKLRIQVRDADEPAGSTTADSNIATRDVTVNNVAPKVNLIGPNLADEGDTKTYNFTITDPGADTFQFPANYPTCGQYGNVVGTPDIADLSFQCLFPDGDRFTDVAVKVADDDDGVSVADTEHVEVITVEIANVPPSVAAPANQSSNEGESKLFSLGSFSDPGTDSPWTVDVDWGDGSNTSFQETATGAASNQTITAKPHTYGDNGTYTVTVKVTDKNGGSDTKTFTVTVANVNPTASNGQFTFNPVLGTATAGFDFSDVGYLDTHGPNLSYFTWNGVDAGNRYAAVTGQENVAPDATGKASDTRTLNPGCYNLTVTGTAVDDDGGDSDALPIYSNSQASVYSNAFRPPIQDNERNIAKFGNVVPVKVQLTNPCTGTTVTNQSLYITVAKGIGDEAIEDTNVIVESVSSADTGQQMRVADGGYIYNLSTKSLSANTNWTVRVRLDSTTGPIILQAVLYPKK